MKSRFMLIAVTVGLALASSPRVYAQTLTAPKVNLTTVKRKLPVIDVKYTQPYTCATLMTYLRDLTSKPLGGCWLIINGTTPEVWASGGVKSSASAVPSEFYGVDAPAYYVFGGNASGRDMKMWFGQSAGTFMVLLDNLKATNPSCFATTYRAYVTGTAWGATADERKPFMFWFEHGCLQ